MSSRAVFSNGNDDDDAEVEAIADKVAASLDFNALDEQRAAVEASGRFPESIGSEKDIPSCDACGKEWSGNLSCSRCHCVFYCGKQCQRAHWGASHKANCDTLQAESQRTALQVVERLQNPNAVLEMDPYELNRLDMAGPFNAAVRVGLYPAMQEAFRLETDHEQLVQKRLTDWATPPRTERMYSLTANVACAIFRGERVEGRGGRSKGFGCVDAYRIKKYLQSSSSSSVALDAWFDASLASVRVMLDPRIVRSPHHSLAQRSARDIWAAWLLVLANPRAARAVLWNNHGRQQQQQQQQRDNNNNNNKDDIATQAKGMIAKIKPVLAKSYSASMESDPNLTLQGCLYQFVAMLDYHLRELCDIRLDVPKLLKFDKREKVKYISAMRLGVATIKKGRFLNNAETQVAMQGTTTR